MRAVHWLYVVSLALFISGIGFVIAAARTARTDAVVEPPATMPVASIRQIMNGITTPAATVVYNAVGTIVNANGVTEIAPRSDEEWAAVVDSAAALVESGNLLLLGNRMLDTGDWVTRTQDFLEAGQHALRAAEARDADELFAAGAALAVSCDTCHATYQR